MPDTSETNSVDSAPEMTVDKALALADEWTDPDDQNEFTDATDVLAAEVRRLRGEQKLDGAEIERLQKVVADQALTIGSLKDELERERMRLAACSVAALGYFEGCAAEYESASLHDTVRLYAEKERLRLENSQLQVQVNALGNEAEPEARSCDVNGDDKRNEVCAQAAKLLDFGPDNNMSGLFYAYSTLVRAGIEPTPKAVADELMREQGSAT